jgi:hypothetical protein
MLRITVMVGTLIVSGLVITTRKKPKRQVKINGYDYSSSRVHILLSGFISMAIHRLVNETRGRRWESIDLEVDKNKK